MIDQLNGETFDNAVGDGGLYVVKFYTKWCPDCVRTEMGYKQLAETLAGTARFGQVNADEQPDLAQRFSIRGIPTLIVFRDGQESDRLHSRYCKTKAQMEEFLKAALGTT
ncbi:thiol reductase thioredoxin [Heliobacterium gestii]|uniref:Thiol reductase thioredoxin n=1 Tax=Heliomicrobium gestii TaxID=2699 RepID=A0A845LDB1_HELGE|nr:thioredoxin family protein [Heliomicrobium gestii]MBM7867785.1 thioredoxin-like negative regulator of GroEL [Heliomicrobium gestii]MZP44178.1 thiol reductase thioredoxin [Heliomicrobium gestii]